MRRFLILFMLFFSLFVSMRGQTITDIHQIDLSGLPQSTTVKTLRYWFDDEVAPSGAINTLSGQYMLDVSSLMDGLHTLHLQIIDNKGVAGYIGSNIFLKMGSSDALAAMKLLYWFDDDNNLKQINISGGVQLIDASALTEGLHTLHYQVMDSQGQMTPSASTMFLRVSTSDETLTAKKLRYWFDEDATTAVTTNVTNGTRILDVSMLSSGLHALHYQVMDSQGQMTTPVTRVFMKNLDDLMTGGTNHVAKYQYWLNQNSQAMKTIELDGNIPNPYKLISLLPMQKEPIQSSNFHFEMMKGAPTIIAKNVLHMRFYDTKDYFVDSEGTFVDYQTAQKIEPVGEIQTTQTFSKVPANDIRWYTLPAEEGDTVAFRLSQPATVQVFAPSGKEVFKTLGAESVKWDGIHTWEDGTYYAAVHDVTGSQSDMTLNYMHMDKYDVVDWDVHTVGNGGCSSISFKGNGFRDLGSVDLYTAEGDTIHSVDVGHESDAETSVTFDFSGAELGIYNAVFYFADEDKRLSEIVTVEEAVDIELITDVSFPSSFLRGTSTTYTIKIKNKGNMTAYSVPIYTWIMNKGNKKGIYHIDYKGLDLAGIFDDVNMDSLSVSERAELQALSESLGAEHHFLRFRVADEDSPGDSVWVRSNYFFTNIAPSETKTIQLTLSANEEVWAYFTVPEDWRTFSSEQGSNGAMHVKARFKEPSLKDKYCCVRSKVECVFNLAADATGIANTLLGVMAPGTPADAVTGVASCAADALSRVVSAAGDAMCGKNDVAQNALEQAKALANNLSIAKTLSGCASKLFGAGKIKAILEAISTIADGGGFVSGFNLAADVDGCREAFSQPIPNCPPNPNGGGGTSTPQPPSDPNDIYGYLSDAGNKFMADTVAKVNYTIEFENDPEFATASAHTIVIKDTLDSPYFDLKSFQPTGVRLGEREVFLDEAKDVKQEKGVTSFLKTIDMRPEIYAIAQVEGNYNQQKGIATWTFTSLDPMSMEPTDELIQGILPVNIDGTSGIGEVMFEVGVKPNKGDGTEVKNRASIVFDYEEPILTPTWTNIVDAVAPESYIKQVVMENDTVATLHLVGSDNRSGVWRYNVYVQAGEDAPWWLAGENLTTPTCQYTGTKGVNYGFYVAATDSAGNVEKKAMTREVTVNTITRGDANDDNIVNAIDAVLAINYYLDEEHTFLNFEAADVVKDDIIDAKDVVAIQQIYLNTSNNINNVKRRKYRSKP